MGSRKSGKTIGDAVREVCLSFPEAQEEATSGAPNYSVRGKTFAMFTVNHHGDGRVALWLSSPPGAQEVHTRAEPKAFFVPPYVGPRGWLGVQLDKGLSWKRIAVLVREAYEKVAPRPLAATIGDTVEISPPTDKLTPEQLNPLKSKRVQGVLDRLRKMVLAWPETSEGESFGSPVWRVGQKTFAGAHYHRQTLKLQFRIGVDRQGLLVADERYTIPKYTGHNGWIDLNVEDSQDWDEIRALALDSYRHFAGKRNLATMDRAGEGDFVFAGDEALVSPPARARPGKKKATRRPSQSVSVTRARTSGSARKRKS